jgi:hypothetical protein
VAKNRIVKCANNLRCGRLERGKREADLLQPIYREAGQASGAREVGQASGAKGDVCRAETGRAEGRQQRRLRSMVGMGGKPLDSTLTIA